MADDIELHIRLPYPINFFIQNSEINVSKLGHCYCE